MLTVRAEKKQERNGERHGVHVSERAYGTFQRSLPLPFPVDPDQVQANFENGVLQVTLPKTQPQERNRRVQVQVGSSVGQQGPQQQISDGETGQSQAGQNQAGQVNGAAGAHQQNGSGGVASPG